MDLILIFLNISMAIQSSLKMYRAMFINTLNTILVSYTVGIVF